MVRLAGANAFGSNRLQRYAYFSEWQYVDPKKILFVALTLVKVESKGKCNITKND